MLKSLVPNFPPPNPKFETSILLRSLPLLRSAVHNCRAHEWDPAEPRNPHYHVVAGHYCFVLRCLNDSTDRFQESVDMTYDSEDSLRKCHEVCGSPRCSASVCSSASTTTMQPAAEKWFRICDFSSPGLRMSMRSKFSALLLEMGCNRI